MTDQVTPPAIVGLLAQASGQIGWVGKEGRNTSQGYSFRGIDDVMAAAAEPFRELGIVVAPRVISAEDERFLTRNNAPSVRVTLLVEFTFYASSDGSSIVAVTRGEGIDQSDKASNKAMSVALKYALIQVLCLPTHEPYVDADAESPEAPAPAEAPAEAPVEAHPEAADAKAALKRAIIDLGIDEADAGRWAMEAAKARGVAQWDSLSLAKALELAAWVKAELEKLGADADAADAPGNEVVEADMWGQLYELLGTTDPTVGTNEAIEKRTRRLWSLAESLGVVAKGEGGSTAMHVKLMEWYGAEHYGDLRVKANMQEFATKSWDFIGAAVAAQAGSDAES